MTVSLDTLSAFVEVAKHLSVSRAAKALGIPKSAVSKRVANLEASVNTTLFSRSTRKIALTTAGELYFDFAQRTVVQARAAHESVQDLHAATSGALTGPIRLTAPVSWGQQVLAKQLPAFVMLHPGVEIELQLSDRMMDLAYERIDLALRWSTASMHGLASELIASVDWIYVASPSYLAQAGTPTHPHELVDHSCMCYWQENADDTWAMSDARDPSQRVEVRVRSRFHANNPETVTEAAMAGCGIALLPGYACAQALRRKKLVRLLRGWTPETKFGTHITAVAAPERMRIARISALVGYLRTQSTACS
jgi:DNA-binding transcriptional LysR family regulator